MSNDKKIIITSVEFTYDIPETSEEEWKPLFEKWLQRLVPAVINNIMDNHFDEALLEAYDEDFEGEPDSLDELGDIKWQVVRQSKTAQKEERK